MARVIADPACAVLLAWVGERLAGYAIVHDTPAPACVTAASPLKLWRLYLGEGFIGRGLGVRRGQRHTEGQRPERPEIPEGRHATKQPGGTERHVACPVIALRRSGLQILRGKSRGLRRTLRR